MQEEPASELRAIFQRRFDEAVEAGLTAVEAALFADSDQDVGLLRRLVAYECPAALIAGIVI